MATWAGGSLTYPSDYYPSDANAYPTGVSDDGRTFLDVGNAPRRWNRLMGAGTLDLYTTGPGAAGDPVYPRAVMHDIKITRGRSGSFGSYEPTTIQATFTGVGDPDLLASRPLRFTLDKAATNTPTPWASWLATGAEHRGYGFITDVERTLAYPHDRDSAVMTTKVTATGTLARAGRLDVRWSSPNGRDVATAFGFIKYAATAYYPDLKFRVAPTTPSSWNLAEVPNELRTLAETLDLLTDPWYARTVELRDGTLALVYEFENDAYSSIGVLNANNVAPLGPFTRGVDDVFNHVLVTQTVNGASTTLSEQSGGSLTDVYSTVVLDVDKTGGSSTTIDALQQFGAKILETRADGLEQPPRLRVDLLRALETGDSNQFKVATSLDVGDWFHIQGIHPRYPFTPNPLDPAGKVPLWVEGIEEHLSADEWTITFTVSPYLAHSTTYRLK